MQIFKEENKEPQKTKNHSHLEVQNILYILAGITDYIPGVHYIVQHEL